MTKSRIRSALSIFVATAALAGIGFGVATAPAEAAGLRNCVEITEAPQFGRVGCYELVWADGVQFRMTFSNQRFDGATTVDLDPFYVLAPQTDDPQGYPPNTFGHDHVVRAIPAGNHGTYSTRLQGYFVFCTGAGLVSGTCVPMWTSLGGPDPVPFATTVNGQALNSTESIESAADAGLVSLVNLGPTAVIVGTISGQ